MKVSDLIEALSKANPDYEVKVEGINPEYWIEEEEDTATVHIKGNHK